MSLEKAHRTMYPTLPTAFICGTVNLIVSQHVTKALAAPVGDMLCLIDVGHIFGDHSFPKHIELLEDAFIGEM